MDKILVVYYSHSGNTKKLAEQIAGQTHADLLELQPLQEYPRDYNTVVQQAKKEIEKGLSPALQTQIPSLDAYSVLLVGTPNWWSTIAPPVKTFLQGCKINGKKAGVFATHGGGGFGHIERDFQALCSGAQILDGFSAYGTSFQKADVQKWLRENQILTD